MKIVYFAALGATIIGAAGAASAAPEGRWENGMTRSGEITITVFCRGTQPVFRIEGHADLFSTHESNRLRITRTKSDVEFNVRGLRVLSGSTAEFTGGGAIAVASIAADGDSLNFGDMIIYPGPFRHTFSATNAKTLTNIIWSC